MSKKTRFTHERGAVVQFAVGQVTLAEIQIILVIFGAFCRTLNLDEMKKFYLVIVALCLSVAAHGQLQPPVQSDTLVIQSVRYNFIRTYGKRTGRAISLSKARRLFGLVIK